MNEIEQNYLQVMQNIEKAAAISGRDARDIRVVAVCKKQPKDKVLLAVQTGISHLAENYPEQALDKIQATTNRNVSWHMIGHIQSRKVKLVSEYFDFVHSLDSISTMEKLNTALRICNKKLECLLEVNLAGEETKSGFRINFGDYETLSEIVQTASEFSNLKIKGLMVMPPFSEDGEASRKYFKQAKTFLNLLQQQYPHLDLKYLSMGTSQDYPIAVEEGATHVRIGTALFGAR